MTRYQPSASAKPAICNQSLLRELSCGFASNWAGPIDGFIARPWAGSCLPTNPEVNGYDRILNINKLEM